MKNCKHKEAYIECQENWGKDIIHLFLKCGNCKQVAKYVLHIQDKIDILDWEEN